MPFSTQEEKESEKSRPAPPEPILRPPRGSNLSAGRVVGVLFLILVLAAVIFLLYTYNFLGSEQPGKSGEVRGQTTESPPSAVGARTDSSAAQPQPRSPTPTMKSSPTVISTGKRQYSIYIAAYAARADAEEEVGRWRDAGYDAFVYDVHGWFRVALGHFESIPETQPMIDSLEEGFEQGYWVGPS